MASIAARRKMKHSAATCDSRCNADTREPVDRPPGLVGGRAAEGADHMEALADGVDVGQAHELHLAVGIVFGALAAASLGPVGHGRRVRPRVQDQHLALGR